MAIILLGTKLKSVLKSEDALQRYWGLKIDFSENFDSAFLVLKIVLCSNLIVTRIILFFWYV